MFNIYVFGYLVWIGFVKMAAFEEISIVSKKNEYIIINEETLIENLTDINAIEIEDAYDDYMKVLLVNGLQFRNAVQNKAKLWENGIVPFVISEKYTKENKEFILESMEEFHNKTCIKFHERKDEASYIMMVPGSGCSAFIGKVPNNSNRVILHQNCFAKGIVLHELMHALGFIHEQNRPDRDEFVKIMFENIRNGTERNFKKYPESDLHLFNQTYDYESVMHYGAQDFAKDRKKPTIIPLKENVEIGQRKGFSEKDLTKINLLYNCIDKQNSANRADVNKENTSNVSQKIQDIDFEADRRLEKLPKENLHKLPEEYK